MTLFTDLGLAGPLLSALEAEGYVQPTPIQAKAIPPLLEGSDLLGIAQTGTGKTAAFALPILQRLSEDKTVAARGCCRALVLAPTRELASQIAESFRTYGRQLTLKVAVVFGGVSHRPQIEALNRGVDVLVATPGRLIDHMMERNVSLASTSIFVLDEADQMLDLGFLPAIRRIVKALPRNRQNLFFSATMPRDIASLADDLLHDPVRIAVARVGTAAEKVAQRVIHIDQRRKSALLAELLADNGMHRTLVFTRTKRSADKVARYLVETGTISEAIHGNKSQSQRERALEAFRDGKCRVLVATDIAARGIDIDGVSHVVNFDLPEVADAYVHRIGRTARAGADGQAIAFCDPEERSLLRAIERLIRQTIPSEDRRGDESLTAQQATPQRARGSSGGRDRNNRQRRPAEREAAPFRGRSDDRDGARPHGDRPAADSRNGQQQRRNGGAPPPRPRHRDDQRRPEHGQASAPAGNRNRNESNLDNVAFLAERPKPSKFRDRNAGTNGGAKTSNGRGPHRNRDDRSNDQFRAKRSSSERNGSRQGRLSREPA
ncbi:MAG: DEAD/DEAH box helicase [Hyphomicrobiaceae bacterium]